jgi:hypothetical protein
MDSYYKEDGNLTDYWNWDRKIITWRK